MIEYRTATSGADASGDAVNGLVTPFGVETVIGDLRDGGFRENIAPSAFKKTLSERDILFLFDHDSGKPLARTSVESGEGSLKLHEAADGLRAEAEPVKTSYGLDLLKLAKARVVRGMSFGFEVLKDSWQDDEGRDSDAVHGTRRTIQEVRLHEVSAVTFPAYTSTTFSARDAVNAARGVREERSPKPHGDVEYADPKNGKYPINTVEHAKAAWSYIHVATNAAEYPLNGVTLEEVKSRIKAALKKFGVEISEENSAGEAGRELRAEPVGSEHSQCLASIDAALDEALRLFASCDRNALPAEANQAIDLLNGASEVLDKALNDAGIPDPDEASNTNEYSDGAGEYHSDEDEAHRADLAHAAQLEAAMYVAEMDLPV